ncbi:MAG: transposase family protein [Nitrospiraceae bacterium]
MISYRATLDVPATTLRTVTAWLQAHRAAHDARPWQRAATAREQAVLALRWLKENTSLRALARDSGISIATAYRYLHEALEVISTRQPGLHEVLDEGLAAGWEYVCLDGTLIETSRCAIPGQGGHDAWYSGKHKHHGGNVQVLTDPSGYPVWVSPVSPGSTHDITAAREHALPALNAAAAKGLRTLTDKGYTGAGAGIEVPVKGKNLDTDTRARNRLISILRAPAERANALLKTTWKALRHVTLSPERITEITAAAIVLLHLQRGTR